MSVINAIIAACQAYVAWVQHQRETTIDQIEDEIDRLAADATPAAKLRIARLGKRLQFKREQLCAIRPADSNPPAQ